MALRHVEAFFLQIRSASRGHGKTVRNSSVSLARWKCSWYDETVPVKCQRIVERPTKRRGRGQEQGMEKNAGTGFLEPLLLSLE